MLLLVLLLAHGAISHAAKAQVPDTPAGAPGNGAASAPAGASGGPSGDGSSGVHPGVQWGGGPPSPALALLLRQLQEEGVEGIQGPGSALTVSPGYWRIGTVHLLYMGTGI